MMHPFPILYTTRLILRKLDPDDIPSLVKYAGNRNVSRYILNIPYPYQEPDAVFRLSYILQGFKAKSRYIFAVVLKESGEMIGEISFHLDMTRPAAQLAYWIGEPFWGKGIATEAITAMLQYGFTELQLDQVFATCDQENTASGRVLEKNGLQKGTPAGTIDYYSMKKEYYAQLHDQH
ncbi:GNAT family N-acetyltransferase [Chitinophaga sp. Cy-1792]|uniref:GNAT family N-acetyltransferase n=1 Tax=Chitinophaga sp. Cy-1792 TaxID=2608339 RepID=UPI00141E136C|nr:GNAT family N-acetyltransferase [Chitinophaga sp. Cy-1792]NIG55963.1 GNAT family N-acetyltransferase [Chitinophaga sp. Cy-1792]